MGKLRVPHEILNQPGPLTSEELDQVRECAGNTCGWLFVDMSRNHSRHWCDMRDCGNRAKVRRYYQRRKTAK